MEPIFALYKSSIINSYLLNFCFYSRSSIYTHRISPLPRGNMATPPMVATPAPSIAHPPPAAGDVPSSSGRPPRASNASVSGAGNNASYSGVEITTRIGRKGASVEGEDRILAIRAERHREAASADPDDFDSLYSWALVLQVRRHTHTHTRARALASLSRSAIKC